jgi:hypothetical protein
VKPNVDHCFSTECLEAGVGLVQLQTVNDVDGLVRRVFKMNLDPEKEKKFKKISL